MKRTRLLTQLQAPQDLDYVERFQTLAAVNLEIRRTGPSSPRLLRKAALEMDIGNHAAALAAARHACQLTPKESEAHFQVARALVLLALVRSKAIAGAPGTPDETGEAPAQLLHDAVQEFKAVLRLNPEDLEALEDVAILETMMLTNPTDRALEQALRRQVEGV